MKPVWGDLVARSRGLGTHLLTRSELGSFADLPDLPALAGALSARGYLVEDSARASGAGLEIAVRRHAAARLRTLGRWCGRRNEMLVVVFEDEDRRSLRSMLRGAVQHAAPDGRMSGLVPTPSLPERALQELSRQATPRAIATTLTVWKSPYGVPLLPETAGQEPDLLRMESVLNRTFAARALGAARLAGAGGLLFAHVRQVIDIENAYSALALAGDRQRDRVPDAFLSGGALITRDVFDEVMRLGSTSSAADRLAAAFGPGPLGAAFRAGVGDAEGPERAVIAAQIAGLKGKSLREPLGPATVLHYALRLRAEVLDVRRIIWGLSLGAPGATIRDGLVIEEAMGAGPGPRFSVGS